MTYALHSLEPSPRWVPLDRFPQRGGGLELIVDCAHIRVLEDRRRPSAVSSRDRLEQSVRVVAGHYLGERPSLEDGAQAFAVRNSRALCLLIELTQQPQLGKRMRFVCRCV